MMEPELLRQKLHATFPSAAQIELEDLTGTKDHFKAVIVDEGFRGKTRVEQHQLVYRALGELMHGPIHALALETRAP